MAKLNSTEVKILDEIAGWKAEGPGFLNRATEFVSKPIGWLTDKLVPESVKGSASDIADTIAEKLKDVSRWSVNPQEVLEATREFEITANSIPELKKASIHDLDHVAQKFIEGNTRVATLSGIGTGLVGWPGLIADLPTLFLLSMRSIHQIALCYGFDPNGENHTDFEREFETQYIMRIFKIATASDKVQKQRALGELKDFEAGRDEELAREIGSDYTTKQLGKNASSFVSQRIIREIVEQTISKKAAALVPGLGAVFSAGFNYVYLKDVGEAAYMLYRERFLLDKKGRKKIIQIDIE
ncbi:MAG: EcsC family protein [Bacteroidetes bacterium]|nr:MAG: EcsC family protein [Bacteroidota bacterium]